MCLSLLEELVASAVQQAHSAQRLLRRIQETAAAAAAALPEKRGHIRSQESEILTLDTVSLLLYY